MARLETLTALDIGTSKVVCVIAELAQNGDLEMVARAVQPCRGLRRGALVDAEEAVRALEAAVQEAEKKAGYPVGPALVSLSSEFLTSRPSHGVWPVGNPDGEITAEDVRRVVEAARQVGIPSDGDIVHAIPRGFSVDGQKEIRNPVGLSGLRLEADAHVIAGSSAFLQNIRKVVQRAGLEIHSEGLVASSIASSLAVMTDEERDLGTAMIDVGLGTVDLAVYCGGEIGHSAVLKMGGDTLVQEVARVFRIPPMEVERLILEAGIASPEFLEGEEEAERLLEAPTVAGDGVAQITRRQLAEVLEGRLLDILEWVARQIHFARRRLGLTVTSLVLTGGVSQLPGMALVAHRELDIPARVAAPCYPPSLPQMLASPIYSTSVGLVLYGATRLHRQEVRPRNVSPIRALWDKVHYSLMQLF